MTLAAVGFASVAFGVLAVTAHGVAYFPIDLTITRAVQQLHDPVISAALGALSWIGFPPVVGILYGGLALALFIAGRRRQAILAGCAALGGAGLNIVSKTLVARPRPPASLVHVAHDVPNGSFPAGHVLNATAFLGFLCYLAWTEPAPTWRRIAVVTLLGTVIAGMGVSRIYSGEHWPSDVLGGYLLGGLWLFAIIAAYRRLESRAGRTAASKAAAGGTHRMLESRAASSARRPVRTRRWGRTLLLAACGLACAQPAWAYRPFTFSDADVAESKSIEVEFAPAEFEERGPERALHAPNLGLAFGLGGGYELGVEGINQVTLEPKAESRPRLVDSDVSIVRLLRRGSLQGANGLSVAAGSKLLLPTPEASHLGAELSGVVSDAGRAGAVHTQLEASRLPAGNAAAGGGLILESNEYRGWRPVVEFALEGARGEPPDRAILLGTIFEARDGLAFDFGVNLGSSEDVRWTEVRSGVTWQIGPRGTAPLRHLVRFHLRRRRHQDD